MTTKLLTLLKTCPRTALAMILATLFILAGILISIVKSVSILVLLAFIAGCVYVGKKSWHKLRDLY